MRNLKNSVQLIGNLGKDPEVKSINGRSMAKVLLATEYHYKNAKGERIKETQWHNLVAWGGNAEFATKFLQKGKAIAVEGRLVNRSFENEEGKTIYMREVLVNEFQFIPQSGSKAA